MSGCGMSWENDGRNAYRHSRDHIEKRKTHCHKYNNTKNNHTKGMGVLLIMNSSMKLMLEMSQGSKLFVCQGDITKLDVDCIVNAANRSLLGGGGVDGAIHRAAGPGLLQECRTLHGCETGQAKITKGYNLKATYVIHTVGPVYSGKTKDAKLLANCYWNSLELAQEHGVRSIAFPAISTGVYGYPKKAAAAIVVETVQQWMKEHEAYVIEVILCGFDRQTCELYEQFLS